MKSKRAREAVEPENSHVDPVEIDAPSKKRKRSSDDAVDVKKAKKEKKDKKDKKDKKHKKESRKERKEKRKDLQDLPGQDDDDNEVDDTVIPATNGGVADDSPMADAASHSAADAAETEKSAKRDKKKKEKKAKKLKGELQDTDAANEDAENPPSTADKKKKHKKASHDDSIAADTDANADADADANADADADADAANTSSQKGDRHIVFVGNLPFTATASTIETHFASLSPASVRCMSDPKSDKPCRGFAFVEFSKVWHMRTCLDKFHHSMFNDGVSPPRRINVELTAGGGGKTKQRRDKIKEKNRKLDENRIKRIEREKLAKNENRNGNSATEQQQHMEDSIHPSRRGRVPGEY